MSSHYLNIIPYGNVIFCRRIENGKKIKEKIQNFSPRIWVPAKDAKQKTEYKTLFNYPVEEFCPGNIRETREFILENKTVDNFAVYGDIQTQYQYISEKYSDDIHWDINDITIATIDIETTCENGFPDIETANEEVNAIAVKYSNDPIKYIFGCQIYLKSTHNQHYIFCKSEEDLLDKFLISWKEHDPDIVTGWNVKYFDLPYIINRLRRLFSDTKGNQLSPWGIVKPRNMTIKGQEYSFYDIFGISILDYMELYKKFTYIKRETYKLDYIAQVELGIRKVDYSQYGSLHMLYKNNFELFIDYNAFDVDIVLQLEEAKKLVELAITMAYDAKVNFEDVFSAIRMWDVIIYNHLLKKKVVIPAKRENIKEEIKGAFVKDPPPGMYNWVVSLDLTSLYPMLIMMYNLSPETLIRSEYFENLNIEDILNENLDLKFLKEKNISMASNGHYFSKQAVGFLPELMAWMFAQRKEYKKLQIKYERELEDKKETATEEEKRKIKNLISKYKNLQMAKKIALNSAYGATANEYFRYYEIRIAEAITKSGQLSIRWIEKKLNEWLNKLLKTTGEDFIIAIDTDSVYIKFEPIVNRFFQNKTKHEIINLIDKICIDQIIPFIHKSYAELANYINGENKMDMKREAIAERGIWTAKKRYILNLWDLEGVRYHEPQLKIVGIEAIKSSTPSICRTKIKEAIKIMLSKTEKDLIKFVSEFKKEYQNLSPEVIAFPRSVTGLKKFKSAKEIYSKGTPINSRGALLYNHYIKKLKLTSNYVLIKEGDHIKYIYLKKPNVIHEDVIAFSSELPKEFDVHDSIDFEKQFQKSFIDPLSLILNAINWNYKKTASLANLFE